MGLYQLKPAFQRVLRPTADWLVVRQVSPDLLSAASVMCALAGASVLLWAPLSAAALLAPLVVARLALNALDGMVARSTQRTDPRGYVVNELTDRVSDVLLLGALALSAGADQRVGVLGLVFALLGSHLAVASQAAGGPRPTSGPMGKSERMAVLGLAGVAAAAANGRWPLEIAVWLMLLGLLMTLADRARRIGRGISALNP